MVVSMALLSLLYTGQQMIIKKIINILKGENRTVSLILNWIKGLVLGRKYCLTCKARVTNFNPLPELYRDTQKKYSYKYIDEPSETLNEEQYTCPLCNASDRDRLISLYLKEVVDKQDSLEVLQFAPSGPLKKNIDSFPAIRQRSADLYMPNVDDIVNIMNLDIYKNSRFDYIICSHVLEHVEDDIKALSELYRILKYGGVGILLVPIHLNVDKIDEDPTMEDISDRWHRFGQGDHIRLYSKEEFINRISSVGFEVLEYNLIGKSADFCRKYGFSETSTLYLAIKK